MFYYIILLHVKIILFINNMSHAEIIPNLWLGNKFSTSIFEGESVLSIGCNSLKTFPNYLKLSLKDSIESNIALILHKALQFINNELNDNHTLLVHCQGGINRSPAIIIAYLVIYKSYTIIDASILVKTKKPSIRLQQHYLNCITEFSKTYKEHVVVDNVIKNTHENHVKKLLNQNIGQR
jgi:protein-tyrosine phosphatase